MYVFARRYVIILLSIFSVIGIAITITFLSHMQSESNKNIAIQNAKNYSDVLRKFRELYTSEVIQRSREYGIEVTHDYKHKKALPLPATLSMLIGNEIQSADGLKTYLYSQYPFPWRKEGLNDKFRQDAWRALNKNKAKPFYRYENINGEVRLRYAKADIMYQSCVKCHNTHKDTPKNDWKVGDVRGVLEVSLPMKQFHAETQNNLNSIFWLLSSLTMLGIIFVSVVFRVLNQNYEEMKEEVQHRKKVEQLLHKNMVSKTSLEESNQRYKAIVEAIPDQILDISLEEKSQKIPDIFYKYLKRAQKTQMVQSFEYKEPIDGNLHDYEVFISAINENAGLAFVRDNTHKRQMEYEILNISEYERKKIGQDIHDDLGQQLASISYIVNALNSKYAKNEDKELEMVENLVRQAIQQTRSLARGLYPMDIEEKGFIKSIESLVQQTESFYKIKCVFKSTTRNLDYPLETLEHLYRIVQESVHNIVKHSKATEIEISVEQSSSQLIIAIQDNGIGLPKFIERNEGMGLNIMRYRANIINASLCIESNDSGTSINCKLFG